MATHQDTAPSPSAPTTTPKPKLSKARIEANRRNAQKSTGPRTEEGKAKSRQNALKHGYSGAGIVLHPEDQAVLKERVEDWSDVLEPEDPLEGWLVGRAALASVRLDRAARSDQAGLETRLDWARHEWAQDERQAAQAIAAEIDTRPDRTCRLLRARGMGCEWLINQWAALDASLCARGQWTDAERTRALHLLGETNPPTARSDERLSAFWGSALAVAPRLDPDEVDRWRRVDSTDQPRPHRLADARAALPAADAARATLRQFLAAERDALQRQMQAIWTSADGPKRRRVEDRALFDASPAGERLTRYDRANGQEIQRCLHLVLKLRKEKARQAEARAEAEPGEPRPVSLQDLSAEDRRALVRDVLGALRRRKARKAAPPVAPQNEPRAAVQVAATPAEVRAQPRQAEPFPMPRSLAERVTSLLGKPAASDGQTGHGLPVLGAATAPADRPQNEARLALTAAGSNTRNGLP